jgi:hypothetical protein
VLGVRYATAPTSTDTTPVENLLGRWLNRCARSSYWRPLAPGTDGFDDRWLGIDQQAGTLSKGRWIDEIGFDQGIDEFDVLPPPGREFGNAQVDASGTRCSANSLMPSSVRSTLFSSTRLK